MVLTGYKAKHISPVSHSTKNNSSSSSSMNKVRQVFLPFPDFNHISAHVSKIIPQKTL